MSSRERWIHASHFEDTEGVWFCMVGGCRPQIETSSGKRIGSLETYLDHLQITHGFDGKSLSKLREAERLFSEEQAWKELSDQTYSDRSKRVIGSAQTAVRRMMRLDEKKGASRQAAENGEQRSKRQRMDDNRNDSRTR